MSSKRQDDEDRVEGCPDDDTELVELPDKPGERMTGRIFAFCQAYLSHGNGPRAAREAGYKGSPNCLRVQAHRLLHNLKVRTYLDARMHATVDEKLVTTIMYREAQTADHAGARVRAAELLGKQLGM
jgi:phage terminase small subunit